MNEITIKIPEDELQGCYNCKWNDEEHHRCLAGVEGTWEPIDRLKGE